MTRRRGAGPRLARLIVGLAARIVGKRRRSEWRREWEAELWVASERGRPVVRHALGAFRHAWAVRRHGRVDPTAASRLESVRFSWLDVRLGLRMLTKYPGLSLTSVIGMAVAIAIGVSAFSVIESLINTRLPLPEGDRIVALRNAIVTDPGQHRASLHDFTVWREELESVQDLAAFTRVGKNLLSQGVAVEVVPVARMTASGFRLARTAPLMGRPLLEEDERNDARVVVIAFEEWQRRFAADPEILGRRIGLGGDVHTVVGVMPAGFRFPVDDRYWIPLVFGAAERARADDIPLTVAGRLAEGETLESVQSALTTIGSRMAAAYPGTHERLRPRVLSYTRAFLNLSGGEIRGLQLLRIYLSLLLVAVAVNVAILVYARTATRVGEIAVRTALGASRARIVTQLSAEALVLSGTSAVLGLMIPVIALAKLQPVVSSRFPMPFWVDLGLSPGVIGYALALAVVGAAIVGVSPALKATGPRVQARLRQASGLGATLRLGRTWTALIVGQVAVAVAVLPFVVHVTEEAIAGAVWDPGYPAGEFIEASLTLERSAVEDTSAATQQAILRGFRQGVPEVIRRLEGEPAVAGVSFHARYGFERHELDELPSSGGNRAAVPAGRDQVDLADGDYFALYGMPMLAGRTFDAADARDGATAVIVNEVFADDHLTGRTALGRHLRVVAESDSTGALVAGPWLEIVGVVQDFESNAYEPSGRVYRPAVASLLAPPVHLVLRVRQDAMASVAPRLREIAAAVDPRLQLSSVMSAAERHRQARRAYFYLALGTAAATLALLLLSGAGIYAMMSLTVTRRRREIGIRSALGAQPGRVLSSIFAWASVQLGTGMLLGLIGAITVDRVIGRGPVNDGNAAMLLVVAALMTTIGLVAAIGPARRGLAVQPTEALREE